MCAIHGFCWRDAGGQMSGMLDASAHRGPDGRGLWNDEAISLGHNLLAITDDAAKSTQPWSYAGRYELVFNGEVYNHRALKKRFSDHIFRTESDTEVLAVGLGQYGPDFLRHVDGMFALAWYDRELHTVTLARDSNGARPLYYGFLGGRLAFSSEVRSLLTLGFDRIVSREAFKHYYHAGLVAGPLTMFQGVYKLVPGEVVTFHLPGTVGARFNLNDTPVPAYTGRPENLPRLIAERLRRAVEYAKTGHRRAGVFLSGGMDSGAVLYESGVPHTFTTRFASLWEGQPCNSDADVARNVAKWQRTVHRETLVTEQMWADNFEAAVVALEEPRQGKSHPAYYLTNKLAAANGMTVMLSGDGGDELLAGYKHYTLPSFRDRFAALRANHRGLRNPALALSLDDQIDYLDGWLPGGGLTGDPLNDFMYTDCLHTLAEDFLVRSDKLGGAFGMEARFPFMCSVFRDFVRGIPGRLKTAEGTPGGWDLNNKPLMRAAYHDKLPAYVTGKRKTGWRAPTDEWVIGRPSLPARDDGPARTLLRSLLAGPEVRELFELDDDAVENRFLNNRDFKGQRKPSGKTGDGIGLKAQKELFTAATFAQWFKSFNMRMW